VEKPKLQEKLLRQLRSLAKSFRLDYRILSLEFLDVLPAVATLYDEALKATEISQPASGGDHTWFDNRPVWSRLLDKSFLDHVFPGRVVAFTVLPKLLRIWMSLLDGESQVERDLGLMRAFMTVGRGRSNDDLVDDLIMLKINGPKTTDEVLGKFSVQCVELWRRTHACIVRRRQTKARQPVAPSKGSPETFAAAKRAVLRASVRAKIVRSDASMTAYGVRVDFFKKPLEESQDVDQAWSDGLKKFDTLTKAYSIRNRFLRTGREAFPKFRLRASAPAREPTDHSNLRVLAYIPAHDAAACGAVAVGYESRSGYHACRTADMVIVDELDRFHADEVHVGWIIHLLYIVARGLSVTTNKCALVLTGHLRKIKASMVREHVPLLERSLLFRVHRSLHTQYPELTSAIRAIEKMPASCWRVEVTSDVVFSTVTANAKAASGASSSVRSNSSKAAPKKRGRVSVSNKRESSVDIPDLLTMWTWLKANRRNRNASYTRMYWRKDEPGKI
jgi:hypothetical protein